MSLLRDIQNAAIDASIPLATLLRKCKVLAARLGNAELKQWIDNELNGYESKESLPSYRVLRVNSKGHFSGPFQSGLRNADIPLSCIPEHFRDNLTYSYLKEPIAALESLASSAERGTAKEPWNPDLVAYVGQDIYEGLNCMQAWKVIPINSIVAALDTVRTRVLNFVLEIEAEAPEAGEAPANSSPLPQDKVHQIFNTYITGNVQNVATGSSNVNQKAKSSSDNQQVFQGLLDALSKAAVDSSIRTQATSLVEDLRDEKEPVDFRRRYAEFMSLLADHFQVLGPVVAPYLPALVAVLP
jgi:hypothetical protein